MRTQALAPDKCVRAWILESCPSWPKEQHWKCCIRVKACIKGSNPLLSIVIWPVGQVVKTPPFHGGIMGSNPVRVTYFGGLAQLGERLPYKQDVTGSSPVSPINN